MPRLGGRLVFFGLLIVLLSAGCDDSEPQSNDTIADADGSGDIGVDADQDGATQDTTPPATVGACMHCDDQNPCEDGTICIFLEGEGLCLPTCSTASPSCPKDFACAAALGNEVCIPAQGCCIDDDADGYGQGSTCQGADCDDEDAATNPEGVESCNGIDDDCDGTVDGADATCSDTCDSWGQGFRVKTGAVCQNGACTGETTSDCGLYACNDAKTGCATTCIADGRDDDALCAGGGHCAGGVCEAALANGSACEASNWCQSRWCENDICCRDGRCCTVPEDCPNPSAPSCDNATSCQGTRNGWDCASNQCALVTGSVADDSACTALVKALSCFPYPDVYCTGEADQTAPECATSCTDDSECAATASCDNGVCKPGRGPGTACTDSSTCRSPLTCADGVCCDSACTCGACNKATSKGTCVPDAAGTVCRAASGACDAAETCDGTILVCPNNASKPVGTACTGGFCNASGVCDSSCNAGAPCTTALGCQVGVIDCTTGSPVCSPTGPAAAGTVCRAAADTCDAAETCDGTSLTCPTDAMRSAGTTCRAAVDACDVEEVCDGNDVACPSDAVAPNTTECRAANGACDVAELCDGTNVACPGDAVASDTTVCRAASGTCDVADTCDGTSKGCPDAKVPDDTDCDDGTFCNGLDTCQNGVCEAGTPCADAQAEDCQLTTCDESGRTCTTAPLVDDTACGAGTTATGFCWSGTCYDCVAYCSPHDCVTTGGLPGCDVGGCSACPTVSFP